METHRFNKLPAWFVGEFFGTFILVFFGCGSVVTAVLTGAQVGIFQVAIVWGLGIATAIYLTGALSGAHLNPAVTICLSVWKSFPKKRIVPYIFAQFLGAFIAAAVLFFIYSDALNDFEQTHDIVRGTPGSEASAMIFGEYFPNPRGQALSSVPSITTPLKAFTTEVIGTAILLLVILCATDEKNKNRPQILTAATIGLTVTLLISLLGPLTMACFNPARDFGPRLFSSLAGWKEIPFTANGWGWLNVYILAPIVGGLFGGALYHFFFKEAYSLSKL
ncbi:MAG: MIP/aquaporin family protein [Verrucomicrobiota bacterium]